MLIEMQVRKAKPCERPFKLGDGDGLYLLVKPNGAKLWRQFYRFGGKQKTLAHGTYPKVSLKQARTLRDEARHQLRNGVDPGHQRKVAKLVGVAALGNSFKEVAEDLLAKLTRDGLAEVTLTKKRWLLDFAYPILADKPIDQIKPLDLLAALKSVEGRGKYETARRLRSTCSMVFRHAVATGKTEHDPTVTLRGAITVPKVKHHAAVTEPEQIGALLRAIEDYQQGHRTTRLALKLAMLTFVRPGELRQAEWSEIDFEGAMWRIPAARMKMKREHRVPLARQAIKVLKELREITGFQRWVFPACYTTQRPMSENTLNTALRRMDYSREEMTGHGFRTTACTQLNESGLFHPDAIERQLAHSERNQVRAAYNSAEHMPERIKMMQWWADHLDNLRDKQ
jgi:integrase